MRSPDDPLPEVELGDVPVAKGSRSGWSIGRVTTTLAIVLVAVPVGLNAWEPSRDGLGDCGNSPEGVSLIVGLFLLAVRPTWIVLKALNNAGERALTAWTGRDDFAPARPTFSDRKPKPLDDV